MKNIGLTGGIGSGKSTVAKIFSSLGVPVFEADKVGRELLDIDPNVRNEVIALFGTEVLKGDQVDRKYIASRVFSNQALLQELNSIIHPRVAKDFEEWKKEQESPYILKEVAILFETGGHKQLDKTILVSAPEELRIRRVCKRDNVNREQVLERMNKQWKDSERLKLSDYLIDNSGEQALIPQVLKIHNELIK